MRDRLTPNQALSRGLAVALLGGIGAIHVMWIPHKLSEAPYMGVLFIALAVACAAGAAFLSLAGPRLTPAAWSLAAFLAAAPLASYVSSRLVAWPQQREVVGSWGSPLGTPSVLAEGALLVLAVAALSGAFGEPSVRQASRSERRGA